MFAVALVLTIVGAVGAVGGVVIQLRALAEASESRQVLAGLTRDQQRSVAGALRDGRSLPPELLSAGRHAAQEVARTGVHAVTSASTVALASGMLALLGGRRDTPVWTDVLLGAAVVTGVVVFVVSVRVSGRGRRYLRSHP